MDLNRAAPLLRTELPVADGAPVVASVLAAPAQDATDAFTDLLGVASQLLACPIALLAVIDNGQLRIAAELGLDATLASVGHAICRVLGHDMPLLMLADATADARFRDDPLVAADDGVRFYLGVALFGANGALLGALAVADRTPRAELSAEALAALQRLARLAAGLIERRSLARNSRIAEQISRADFSAVVMVDADGAVTFANLAAEAMFGPAVACGKSAAALFPVALQADPAAVTRWLNTGVRDAADTAATCELRVRASNGGPRTLEAVRCAWASDGDSELWASRNSAYALILRDITDSRRLHQRRRDDAQRDPLTGLPTRAALLVTLNTLRNQPSPLAVALLGLDNFRAINDTLGHAVGDTVLQVVACRLLARLPADAHLARFGGDEFALVFPALGSEAVAAAEALLRTMLRELARPCEADQQRVHLEASVGLAICTGTGDCGDLADPSELFARAGLAMQHAKRASGSQQLRRFSPDMRAEAIDRRKLDLELRRACREGEFELHYQPQVELSSGRPTGAEALLRWRHPERGLLLPVDFIDALAHSAVALTVGRWILQRACRDAAQWPQVDGHWLAVGVNLFPVQFEDEHFLNEVDHALALSGLRPDQLELELTETIALRDDGAAEHALAQLRARGIRVAYDDFGTGYASLSMLHRLPVDRVKIDRSFVCNVTESRGDEAIVRSIALIARNFDLQLIAEGVETPMQAEFLRGLGCQDVQGWLYSKALASNDFDRWVMNHIDALAAKALARG